MAQIKGDRIYNRAYHLLLHAGSRFLGGEMDIAPASSLIEHLGDLDDLRRYNRRHLMRVIAAVRDLDPVDAIRELGEYGWL